MIAPPGLARTNLAPGIPISRAPPHPPAVQRVLARRSISSKHARAERGRRARISRDAWVDRPAALTAGYCLPPATLSSTGRTRLSSRLASTSVTPGGCSGLARPATPLVVVQVSSEPAIARRLRNRLTPAGLRPVVLLSSDSEG